MLANDFYFGYNTSMLIIMRFWMWCIPFLICVSAEKYFTDMVLPFVNDGAEIETIKVHIRELLLNVTGVMYYNPDIQVTYHNFSYK